MILDYPNQPPRSTDDAQEIATLLRKGWIARPEPPAHNPSTHQVRWVDGAWIVEPIPIDVPFIVESHKIKIELTRNGLRGPVTQLINSADQDVKDAWTAPYFHRNSPFIGQFASLLGLTNEEVDQIFINANNRMT